MEVRRMITVMVALALLGCMKPNPLADATEIEQADETDDEGESGGGVGSDGAPGDGDSDDGDELPDDNPDPVPDLGDDEEPSSCTTSMGLETGCAACLEIECCQAAALCSETQSCECLAACELADEPPGACKMQCGSEPNDIPELGLLLECAAAWCSNAC